VDPSAARAEADAFTSGFARGIAAAPGGPQRPSEPDPLPDRATWATAPPPLPGILDRAPLPPVRARATASVPVPPPVEAAAPAAPPQWPLPAAATPAAPQAPAPPLRADGGLTRRVPGANLVEELRLPGGPGRATGRASAPLGGPSPAPGPGARDPDAEARALNTLVAGFARGEQQDLRQSEFVGRAQQAEPQDVERR
jgi:hypothetical protein